MWRISRRRPQSLAEREQRKHAHQHRDQVRLGRGCGTGKSRCRHCSMVCPVLLPTAARRGDTGAKKRPDLSPILPYRKIWFGTGGGRKGRSILGCLPHFRSRGLCLPPTSIIYRRRVAARSFCYVSVPYNRREISFLPNYRAGLDKLRSRGKYGINLGRKIKGLDPDTNL